MHPSHDIFFLPRSPFLVPLVCHAFVLVRFFFEVNLLRLHSPFDFDLLWPSLWVCQLLSLFCTFSHFPKRPPHLALMCHSTLSFFFSCSVCCFPFPYFPYRLFSCVSQGLAHSTSPSPSPNSPSFRGVQPPRPPPPSTDRASVHCVLA